MFMIRKGSSGRLMLQRRLLLVFLNIGVAACSLVALVATAYPLGTPGRFAVYTPPTEASLTPTVVKRLEVVLGGTEERATGPHQWLGMKATKVNGQSFAVFLLVPQYPSTRLREARSDVACYIVQEGNLQPLEYTDRNTKEAVLPALGYWQYQIPTLRQEEGSPVTFPETIQFLGLTMKRIELGC